VRVHARRLKHRSRRPPHAGPHLTSPDQWTACDVARQSTLTPPGDYLCVQVPNRGNRRAVNHSKLPHRRMEEAPVSALDAQTQRVNFVEVETQSWPSPCLY
jgi:hypothetical protein